MLDRRKFFGRLLGLLGLGGVVKADDGFEALRPMQATPSGRWRHDWAALVESKLLEYKLGHINPPNPNEGISEFLIQAADQLEWTGEAFIWMVPNVLGQVCELYVIPTAFAVSQPVPNPDYPDGHYLIFPVHKYSWCTGAVIPAQQMLRIKSPYPMVSFSHPIEQKQETDWQRWQEIQTISSPFGITKI